MVYYPKEELKELRSLLKLRGMQEQILTHTGIAKSTISRISKRGIGTKEKVDSLRRFVIEFYKLQNNGFGIELAEQAISRN